VSMPLDLAYCRDYRKGIRLDEMTTEDATPDLVYFKTYRDVELYKRLDGRFIFARKLTKREIDEFYFNNGKSFRGCTIVER